MKKEIEVLVELSTNIDEAKRILSKFEFIGSKETIDHYYYDPLRDNLKLNKNGKLMECCRIRIKNNQCFVTYKVDIYENNLWKYSNEHETKCENANSLKNIFENLGLQELITIENIKHTYITSKYELVLEEVKGLGHYLEVEYSQADYNESVDEIKQEIHEFINNLGLSVGEELNSGKPELLLLKKNTR